MLSQIQRFFQYVSIPVNTNDCWLWSGWKERKGYGRFRLGGRDSPCIQSHRFMWEYFHERKIPRGIEIDHLCENRGCNNPLHLVAVTPELNKSQRYGKRNFQRFDYAA